MPIIPIPFLKGIHEEADPKLLPQGLFTAATNVRFQKDGRVGVRNGFRHDAANTVFSEANVLAVGKFDQQHALILQKRLGDDIPPAWARHLGSTYSAGYPASLSIGSPIANQQSGSVGVPEILQTFAGSQASLVDAICSSDCVVIGGFIFVVVSAYSAGTTKVPVVQANWFNAYMYLYKIDPSTGAILASRQLTIEQASNVKVVDINGNVGVFWADGANHVRFAASNPALSSTIVAPVTVVTTVAGLAPHFDVCQGATSTITWLVFNSAANTLSFGDVSTVGVYTVKNTIATTNIGRPSIGRSGLNPTDDVVIIWNDGATFITGSTKYTVYRRSTNTFITATTTLSTGGLTTAALGYPVVAESSLDDWTGAWCVTETAGSTPVPVDLMFQTTSGQTPKQISGMYPVSKPFTFGSSTFIGILATDRNTIAVFPGVTVPGAYFLIDNDTPSASTTPSCEAVLAIDAAVPLENTSIYPDPRRKIQPIAAIGVEPVLGGAVVVALPLFTGERGGWGLVRTEYGRYEEMFQTATLNGQLFVSGARVLQYDGVSLVESGLSTPRIVSATPGAIGGTIANGTYLLSAVYEWFDALGNRHLSPPSNPVSVTMAGANNGITVIVSPLLASTRNTIDNFTTVTVRVYRTLAGSSIFQESAGVISIPTSQANTGFTVVLTAPDATVAQLEIIYTQGARGGLSGILQNDRPPPARYIWAGSDRLIIGHTDNPTQYQLSKLRFGGEPINWSNTPAFIGNVDKPITGVAEMDGTFFIGTRDAIWTVGGPGPDDNGSGGTFDTPLRLPSDTGFYSAGSIVLTGKGLMFQGTPDRLYQIPRGGGTPEWIGQPIRDTLLAFPWITSSAFDQDSNLVYFACVNAAGTLGRLLVYDTRINEWSVDNVQTRAIRSLSIFNGLLVIDGSIVETPGNFQDFDGSTSATVLPTLTTGDIRPFGQTGWGQMIKTQMLAEARDVTVAWSATMDVSYDSGKTFGETATWTRANIATAIGDAIDAAEHYFVTQRCDSVRLRFSWTTPSATEGIVWNGLQFEVIPFEGSKRGPPNMRAA